MALFVNDKTNASYLFDANRMGAVSPSPGAKTMRTARRMIGIPLAALAGVLISGVLLYLLQRYSFSPLPLIIGIASALTLARYFGIVASGMYVAGWMYLLRSVPFLASGGGAPYSADGWEAAPLYLGAVGVGLLLHEKHKQVTQLQEEQANLHTALETAQIRQQSFLRDVLTAVTAHRLTLCESPADLPTPLAFAPGEQPIPLASAMLSEVRTRIRKSGKTVGLSDSVIGDLVIAGSEASLNAVVHATGGVAEIRAGERSALQVWVRDTGKGIDDAFLHRAILEAGFSSKGTLGQGFSLIVSTCHRVYLLTGSTGTTIVLETEAPQRSPHCL